ncbi:hypothetical protein AB0B86_01450 [Micromonospora sp. NPDC049047]|uniref:hypothetical protein n=1 Tax=Micromonospora sp. NPDC049047 TaxID=3155645 RepID=UPI0033D78DA5
MTVPPPPDLPVSPVGGMTNDELADLAASRDAYRGRALFELIYRARTDDEAADQLDRLSRLATLREDRVMHLVNHAWAAIVGLLAAGTPHARARAYAAFEALDGNDQANLLEYLGVERIEDADVPSM